MLAKPKILFVHDKPSGGAGESLLQIIRMVSESFDCTVIFSKEGFLKEKFDRLTAVQTYYWSLQGSWLLNRRFKYEFLNYLRLLISIPGRLPVIYRIYKLIKANNIEIVYSNTIYLIEGSIAAKLAGISHFWQVRELYDLDYYNYCLSKTFITKVISVFSEKIIANSLRTRKALLNFGAEDGKVRVLYNIVDESEESICIKHELGLATGSFAVCILGWITPNKRIEDFIDLATHFRDKRDMKFIVIGGKGGDTNYNEMINKKARSSDNWRNIIFTGILKNATDYLATVDLLLCPCYTESFGRTVAEALVSGTPAIGIRGTATEEIIDHGETGFIVDKGDVNAMALNVEYLYKNRRMLKNMGILGKQRVKERFGSEMLQTNYLKLLENR
ncbi:MAG: glycosyltransferase family 4 protein [Bacteroidia bacterium]